MDLILGILFLVCMTIVPGMKVMFLAEIGYTGYVVSLSGRRDPYPFTDVLIRIIATLSLFGAASFFFGIIQFFLISTGMGMSIGLVKGYMRVVDWRNGSDE